MVAPEGLVCLRAAVRRLFGRVRESDPADAVAGRKVMGVAERPWGTGSDGRLWVLLV